MKKHVMLISLMMILCFGCGGSSGGSGGKDNDGNPVQNEDSTVSVNESVKIISDTDSDDIITVSSGETGNTSLVLQGDLADTIQTDNLINTDFHGNLRPPKICGASQAVAWISRSTIPLNF